MEKHNTRNPYEIARKEGITVVIEELGNVFGYYNQAVGQKFIHVNEDLSSYFQSYVIAHMLYAAFTNNEGMQFLKKKKLLPNSLNRKRLPTGLQFIWLLGNWTWMNHLPNM